MHLGRRLRRGARLCDQAQVLEQRPVSELDAEQHGDGAEVRVTGCVSHADALELPAPSAGGRRRLTEGRALVRGQRHGAGRVQPAPRHGARQRAALRRDRPRLQQLELHALVRRVLVDEAEPRAAAIAGRDARGHEAAVDLSDGDEPREVVLGDPALRRLGRSCEARRCRKPLVEREPAAHRPAAARPAVDKVAKGRGDEPASDASLVSLPAKETVASVLGGGMSGSGMGQTVCPRQQPWRGYLSGVDGSSEGWPDAVPPLPLPRLSPRLLPLPAPLLPQPLLFRRFVEGALAAARRRRPRGRKPVARRRGAERWRRCQRLPLLPLVVDFARWRLALER